jgi:hypothetical protein
MPFRASSISSAYTAEQAGWSSRSTPGVPGPTFPLPSVVTCVPVSAAAAVKRDLPMSMARFYRTERSAPAVAVWPESAWTAMAAGCGMIPTARRAAGMAMRRMASTAAGRVFVPILPVPPAREWGRYGKAPRCRWCEPHLARNPFRPLYSPPASAMISHIPSLPGRESHWKTN